MKRMGRKIRAGCGNEHDNFFSNLGEHRSGRFQPGAKIGPVTEMKQFHVSQVLLGLEFSKEIFGVHDVVGSESEGSALERHFSSSVPCFSQFMIKLKFGTVTRLVLIQ